MKIFLSALFVLSTSWPAYGSDLPSEKLQAETETTTPQHSAQSQNHSQGVIERYEAIEDLTNPPSDEDRAREYMLSYNNEGYLTGVTFTDGSVLTFSYTKNTLNNEIQSIQIADNKNTWTIKAEAAVKEGAGGQSVIAPPTARIPLKELFDTLKKGRPAFALSSPLEPSSFQEFLSLLKKPTGGELRQAPVDFAALKQGFEILKSDQDKAFQKYAARTELYYRVLNTALIEETAAKQTAKENTSRETLPRKDVEAWVARSRADDDGTTLRDPSRSGLSALEHTLYKSCIIPGRKELRSDLETAAADFGSKLKELLAARQTSLRHDANITEIVLILPQKRD